MELDTSKPVCTRDGRHAEITQNNNDVCCGLHRYPIRAKVQHPIHLDVYLFLSFMSNGQLKSGNNHSIHDLVNKQIWHEWLNDLDVENAKVRK